MTKRRLRKSGLPMLAVAGVLVSTISIAGLHCPHGSHTMLPHAELAVEDSDLDLSVPSQVFTLYQRLQDAAMHSCYPSEDRKVLPIFGLADRSDCYSEMLSLALAAYDNLSLSRIHERILEPPIFIGLDDG